MKTLIALVASLSLIACAANTDETSESAPRTQTPVQDNSDYSWGHGGDNGFGCMTAATYVHVTVDGHAYIVRIPTLCDPSPYIFKGDPAPDMGDPYEDKANPQIREQIMEKVYAKLATSGGTHSAPVQ